MSEISKERFAHVGPNAYDREAVSRPSVTFMQDAMRRLLKNKVATFCAILIVALVLMSVIAPMVSSFSFREQHYGHINAPMGSVCNDEASEGFGHVHYFGTDTLGRDIFTRAWMGGRVSLLIAIVSAVIDFFIGVIYGGVSGYFGGTVDIIMMRVLEIINGIPYLLIVILLTIIMQPGIVTIIIAYSMVGWIPMARLVRGQVVALKRQEFVTAAEALGVKSSRIIARHLLPNALSVVIVRVTLSIPGAIFTEAYLSYLGLGVPLPHCSWGSLAQLGIMSLRTYPSQLIIPAVCISLTMLAFNMFGDGLRDAFDPKLRR